MAKCRGCGKELKLNFKNTTLQTVSVLNIITHIQFCEGLKKENITFDEQTMYDILNKFFILEEKS
jgi:hypothetical protein